MIQNGRFAAAALAFAALTCSVATAGDDVVVTDWIPLGSGLLGPGESLDFDVDIVLEGDEQGVIGFEVRFGYFEPIPDASWASDAQVTITAPGTGDAWIVGGLTHAFLADSLWSFQGPFSGDPGIYGDSGEDIFLPWLLAPQDAGIYHVKFANDWEGDENPNDYDDISIRFYKVVPAPGALMLLAIAGLTLRRRRRS